jgi:hypothetical protein
MNDDTRPDIDQPETAKALTALTTPEDVRRSADAAIIEALGVPASLMQSHQHNAELRPAFRAGWQDAEEGGPRVLRGYDAELTIDGVPLRAVGVDFAEQPDRSRVIVVNVGLAGARVREALEQSRANISLRYGMTPRSVEAAAALGIMDCPIGNIDYCQLHREAERGPHGYAEFREAQIAQMGAALQAIMPTAEEIIATFNRFVERWQALPLGTVKPYPTIDQPQPSNRRERRALAAGAPTDDGTIKLTDTGRLRKSRKVKQW